MTKSKPPEFAEVPVPVEQAEVMDQREDLVDRIAELEKCLDDALAENWKLAEEIRELKGTK